MQRKATFGGGVLFAAGGVVLLVACSGGSGSTNDVTGAPVPFEQIGKVYAEKICAAIANCCSQNGFSAEHARCTSGAAGLQAEVDKDRTRHPERVYDAQRAGNCIAKLAAAIGTCKNGDFDDDDDGDCANIFRGTKTAGATCTSGSDCAAGLDCLGLTSTSGADPEGVCATMKPAPAEGDPCLDYNEKPEAGKVYADCNDSDALYCDTESNTCKTRSGAGTTCIFDGGSSYLVCNDASYCDFSTKLCAARKAVGEACENNGDQCVENAYCDASKKCAAQKGAGEACNPETSQECLHRCDRTTGKCTGNDISRSMCGGDLD